MATISSLVHVQLYYAWAYRTLPALGLLNLQLQPFPAVLAPNMFETWFPTCIYWTCYSACLFCGFPGYGKSSHPSTLLTLRIKGSLLWLFFPVHTWTHPSYVFSPAPVCSGFDVNINSDLCLTVSSFKQVLWSAGSVPGMEYNLESYFQTNELKNKWMHRSSLRQKPSTHRKRIPIRNPSYLIHIFHVSFT